MTFGDRVERYGIELSFIAIVGFMAAILYVGLSVPPRTGRSAPLTRTLDTLPSGTIVVCYTPTHGDGVACVLDPAMQGATP